MVVLVVVVEILVVVVVVVAVIVVVVLVVVAVIVVVVAISGEWEKAPRQPRGLTLIRRNHSRKVEIPTIEVYEHTDCTVLAVRNVFLERTSL